MDPQESCRPQVPRTVLGDVYEIMFHLDTVVYETQSKPIDDLDKLLELKKHVETARFSWWFSRQVS